MGKRSAIKTSIEEIVDYWAGREDECGLSVDWEKQTIDVGAADVKRIYSDAILFRIL